MSYESKEPEMGKGDAEEHSIYPILKGEYLFGGTV
jgi:hypothetical protein